MSRRVFYPFYPERILWTGAAVIGAGLAVAGTFLVLGLDSSPLSIFSIAAKGKELESQGSPLSFSFHLKEVPIVFPYTRVESEMIFSFDPPRPDRNARNGDLFIRLKQSAESKRIALPCRVDLQFKSGKLAFAEKESPFWLELTSFPDDSVEGVVWVEMAERKETERFVASPQASPLRDPQGFIEDSPFRVLGEARWLGHDVFAEKYGGKQTLRIAVGPQPNPYILDLREKEWIIWHDGRWMKGTLDEKPVAAARIESADAKALILEGWDDEDRVRLSLPSVPPPLFKIRAEEVFNSIRVRSEKQISCMMEKQCLILKSGDWVMKTNGRWKVLRKKEEKEAYQSGKIGGDLFVFEKIQSKQGQKFISGFLFNTEKSQVVPIDLPVNKHPVRKEAKEK